VRTLRAGALRPAPCALRSAALRLTGEKKAREGYSRAFRALHAPATPGL